MLRFQNIANVFLISIISFLCVSCNGQGKINASATSPAINKAIGQKIDSLSESSMIIFQDSRMHYWFGSKEEGVIRYDGEDLTLFTVAEGLYANRVRGIQEDHLGNIYFDTGAGINKFDGQQIEKLSLSSNKKAKWKLEEHDLWFAGNWNKNGVYRYDGDELFHLKLPKSRWEIEYKMTNNNPSIIPYEAYTVFRDCQGHVWVGTSNFGACRYNGESFTWVDERAMCEVDPGPAPGVRSILEDQDGNFWFSSNVDRKYQVPLGSKSNSRGYKPQSGIDPSINPEMGNFFMAILQDKKGHIWMTTYSEGVWRYDGKKIIHYDIKEGDKNVLLFTIYQDRQDQIWLGTHNGGAWKYDGTSFVKFVP